MMLRTLLLFLTLFAINPVWAATDTFTATGSWTAPTGVTSVTVEAWGGGGAGGGQNLSSDGGGGGGGGGYSVAVLTVTPGTSYPVVVGLGGLGVASGTGLPGNDSYFWTAATVMAKGGLGGLRSIGTPPSGGAGGSALAGVGTAKYSGGNGGKGRDNGTGRGGPGGSSAGSVANGISGAVTWSTLTALSPPTGGGIGGNGGNASGNGLAPTSGYGGGGGGSGEGTARTGGAGAVGKVLITYTPAPAVVTGFATSQGATSATLNGMVTSNGASTAVTFEYGLSTAYDNVVTAYGSPLWSGAANAAVTYGLTGLFPGTLYHFRIKGINSSGIGLGQDATFTTLSTAPSVSTGAASGILTTSATLNGVVSSNGSATVVTFEYGLTNAYGSIATASTSPLQVGSNNTAVAALLTGLAPGVTYYFRAKGVNSLGTSYGYSDGSFTTLATAPTVSTGSSTSVASTGATFNGTLTSNGAATTVTFEYGLTASYGSTVSAFGNPLWAGANLASVSAGVSGLTPGVLYHFRIKGVNSAGTSTGLDQVFTTAPIAPTVTSLAATSLAPTGATLNATVASNGADTVVTFEYGTTSSYGSTATVALSPLVAGTGTTAVSVLLTGLLSRTTYYFRVKGVNSAGTSIGGGLSFTTLAPARPTAVTVAATAISASGARLNGEVSSNGAATTVTFDYGLTTAYGSSVTASGSPLTLGASAEQVSAVITGLTPSTLYNFRVKAVNSLGASNGANLTLMTLPPPPTVVSINRASFDPTAAGKSVAWTVTFSDSVTGVDAGDFALTQVSGVSNASIASVTGIGTTWAVTANTGSGVAGSLGLNLIDDDSIVAAGGALGGTGAGNGNFIGQSYTLLPATCNAGANILFCDDFERSNAGGVGNGWTVTPANASDCAGQTGNSGCAGIDSDIAPFSTYANPRPNPTRAMFTRWDEVTIDSPTVNLAGKFAAQLSFWLRRGGDAFSEYPELAGENFLVWYRASNNTWKILAQYPTAVLAGQVFTPVIELPPDALHAGFKVRFNQTEGSGDSGSRGAPGVVGYDYWHVDDVMVKEVTGPRFTGAFCDNFEAGLGRWSISAEGAPTSASIGDASISSLAYQSASRGLDMRWGYVSVATFRTDLRGVDGNISFWLQSGATSAIDPVTGENLVVEYLNSAGTWTLLKTYLGSEAWGTVYSVSYALPADAQHANFRLRFRQLAGSGYDKSYWHLDDVCVGNLLPTADLSLGMTGGTLVPGSNTSYTLKVTNLGPGKLSGSIEIVDTLPAGISFLAGTGTGWVCSANGQQVTCNWTGALDSGSVAPDLVLIVAVSANVVGTITNTATVTGTVIDNVPGNNTVSFTSGVFVPTYVFTNQVCSNGFAIGQPGQSCLLATWSPQIAGQTKSSIFITAVNPLGVPTALNSVSSTSIAFQFGLTCHDPVAHAGIQATFSAVSPSTLPVCNGYSAEPVVWSSASTLSFVANVPSVSTSYTFNYADVGLVELFMRNSLATTQKGTSGQFVVKPYNLLLSEIKPTANTAGRCAVATSPVPTLACASLAAEAAKFVRAGETFSTTVSALASSGAATPNFGKEKAPESVKLSPTNAVAGMVSPPAINGNFASFSAGRASGLAFSWGEVGIITLTPQIADGNYLGVGDVVGTVSGPVGRFYPDHFDTTLTPGCSAGSFSYSGQPFVVDVKALNVSSGLTLNYAGSGGGAPIFSRNVTLSDANLVAGLFSVSSVAQTAFTAGRASASSAFTFNAVSTPPSMIRLRAVDADGVSSASGSEAVSDMRSGRARLFNAYGSELLALPIPFALEYWGANGWTKNSIDSCTSLSSSHFSFNFSSPAGTASKPNNLSACETALTVTGAAPDYLLSLAKPGKPNDGWTTLSLNLGGSSLSANGQCIAVGGAGSADIAAQLPWLQFNWKGAGPTNPEARAVFGLYKKDNAGGGVTIYRRENY